MPVGAVAIAVHPQLLQHKPSTEVPENAITTDSGDAITLDNGTTYVTLG